MAFGVGTPADDWTQEISGVSENKVQHSSLTSPILTNHGSYCRRFNAPSANDLKTFYKLIDPAYVTENSKSIRGFFRTEDTRGGTNVDFRFVNQPRLILNADDNAGSLDLDTGYQAYIGGAYTHIDLYLTMGLSNSPVATVRLSTAADDFGQKWNGLRLDVIKEDQDAHILVYMAQGASVCDNLTNGEPVWTKMLDVIHVNGTTTPTILLGDTAYSFPTTVPVLSGYSAFGFHNPETLSYYVTFVDSVSIKKM